MPIGRPDYWYSMFPGLPGLGSGQTDWYMAQDPSIDTGETVGLLEYTVPAGHVLNITGGLISCDQPGINRFYMEIDLELICDIYFDTFCSFPQQPVGLNVFTAGKVLNVSITNKDTVTVQFYAILTGYLKQV